MGKKKTVGQGVYVVDDQPGRAGSFHSNITLWADPRDAAIVFLVSQQGHHQGRKSENDVKNPQYPDKDYWTDGTLLDKLVQVLKAEGGLSARDWHKLQKAEPWLGFEGGEDEDQDEDEEDFEEEDEDEGYCEVSLMEVR